MKTKKTIFLTGASSILGREFYRLFNTKYNIYRIYRNSKNLTEKEFNVDLTSRKHVTKLFKSLDPIDSIIHFSAQPTVWRSIKEPLDDANSNIMSTLNILEHALRFNIKNFIFTSSESVYSNIESPNEDAVQNPISPYGISKFACEQYIRFFKNRYKINCKIIRPSFVIDNSMTRNPLYDILSQIQNSQIELYQSVNSKFNFVLSTNVCKVIEELISNNIEVDELNFVNKVNTSLLQIIDYLKKKGYKFKVVDDKNKIVNQTLSTLYTDISHKHENDIFHFCDNYLTISNNITHEDIQ